MARRAAAAQRHCYWPGPRAAPSARRKGSPILAGLGVAARAVGGPSLTRGPSRHFEVEVLRAGPGRRPLRSPAANLDRPHGSRDAAVTAAVIPRRASREYDPGRHPGRHPGRRSESLPRRRRDRSHLEHLRRAGALQALPRPGSSQSRKGVGPVDGLTRIVSAA
jgi:hypothetical protein